MFNVIKGIEIDVGPSRANKPPHWPYHKHEIIYPSTGGASLGLYTKKSWPCQVCDPCDCRKMVMRSPF